MGQDLVPVQLEVRVLSCAHASDMLGILSLKGNSESGEKTREGHFEQVLQMRSEFLKTDVCGIYLEEEIKTPPTAHGRCGLDNVGGGIVFRLAKVLAFGASFL